jgi:hypothetical protein
VAGAFAATATAGGGQQPRGALGRPAGAGCQPRNPMTRTRDPMDSSPLSTATPAALPADTTPEAA